MTSRIKVPGLALFSMLIIALLLTACSSGNQSSNPPAGTTSGQPTAASSGGTTSTTATGGNTSAAPGKTYTLVAGHQLAVDTPFDKGLKQFAQLVQQKTNGQVKVEVHANADVGNETDMFQAMNQGGAVDLAVIAPGSVGEFVPELNIFSMPFLVSSREQRDKIISGDPAKKVDQLMVSKTKVRIAGYFGGGIRNMLFTKPAKSIADVQERLLRVQPSTMLSDSFKAAGLRPSVVAYNELYNALQQGVVEGAENESVYIVSQKFYEPAPYILLTQHEVTLRPLMISQATLDRLPKDLASKVLEAAQEASAYERNQETIADDAALQQLKTKYAKEVVTPPDLDKARAAIKPIWQQYAKQWGMEDVLTQIENAR